MKTKRKIPQYTPAMDVKRKRLIAVIFAVFKKMNRPANMALVKATACRAAKVKDFNEITETRLNSLYNAFLKALKDLDFTDRMVGSFILEGQSYN